MKIEFCPRCGTKRPDELQWCRSCGLDFHKAARGELPAAAPTAPKPVSGWVVTSVANPNERRPATQQPYIPVVEVRPTTDRQQMAKWSAHALDVRCGGTAGGCLGLLLGLLAGLSLGLAIGGFAVFFTTPIGMWLGMFAGMRFALALMSK